jgi:hypothetical protein
MDVDIVLSFDTTGSMNQCIRQVRQKVNQVIKDLLKNPNIQIGLIAHGDYCDENIHPYYLLRKISLTRNVDELVDFVKNKATDTYGGDWPECYELVLKEANEIIWRPNSIRRLVMIGDAVPHEVNDNPLKIDWRQQVQYLKEKDVVIYSVHCMDSSRSKSFYEYMSSNTNGLYLSLRNFDSMRSLIYGICYQQTPAEFEQYQQGLVSAGQMTREVQVLFHVLQNGNDSTIPIPQLPTLALPTHTTADLSPVEAGRFQVCEVPIKISIKQFVIDQGLPFKVGRGFYEMIKKENISDKKEIVLRSRLGDFFSGTIAKIIAAAAIRSGNKEDCPDYKIFIQSTSVSRNLSPNTFFLYEMEKNEEGS